MRWARNSYPLWRALAVLVVFIGLLAPRPSPAEPADIAATARGVVRIVLVSNAEGEEPTLIGHGSGVAVAPDVILTNAHVVEPARQGEEVRIGIVPPQGKGGWFARIIAFAPKQDLALVKLTERGGLPPATLFTGAVDDAADVVAVGYPGNVDVAQGLNMGDIVSPTSPVKTRGTVSAGRSSKSFETILHTAPIGAGNSGGPLLDPCGRVIGINSFGTLSDEGDSEFYFAVSGREVLRFLRASGITPRITGVVCRSLAELDRAEAQRLAGEKINSEEAARASAAKKRDALEKAERTALFEVIAERDNFTALAMLALLLALGSGGAAYMFFDRGHPREAKIAGVVAGLLVLGGIGAWLLRPGFSDVDQRAKEWVNGSAAAPKPAVSGKRVAGELICTLDLSRSRVTISSPDDVPLAWGKDGCVDGKVQFGLGPQGWTSLSPPDAEDSVTVATFDPAANAYQARRYFLDLDTVAKLREAQARLPAATCGGGEPAARKLSEAQAALEALLPATPNERLVYDCR